MPAAVLHREEELQGLLRADHLPDHPHAPAGDVLRACVACSLRAFNWPATCMQVKFFRARVCKRTRDMQCCVTGMLLASYNQEPVKSNIEMVDRVVEREGSS